MGVGVGLSVVDPSKCRDIARRLSSDIEDILNVTGRL